VVSATKVTTRRRRVRSRQRGRWNKHKGETPTFPIHPEGYDPKAADARPTEAQGKKPA